MAESIRRLRENTSSKFLTVRVYPGVGHSLMLHENGGMAFTAPLIEDLNGWLGEHVFRRPATRPK